MHPYDSLTGLPNRFHFIELLKRTIEAAQPGRNMAVLFINLDRFQLINGTLGYAAGDELLRTVADRLRGLLAPGDVAGRVGGDEFAVVTSTQVERWLEALRQPYRMMTKEWFVTASAGASIFPMQGRNATELLHAADRTMRRVKKNGGDNLEIVSPEEIAPDLDRLTVENALRRALGSSEFDLVYQPVVDMQGAVDGLETLLTWNHPARGVVPPRQFIPIAEETGLIVSIGAWVMRQACVQGAQWLRSGYRNARISVNVSARQFERCDFGEQVAMALATSGLPPESLDLELTESYLMRNLSASVARMNEIRDLGVRMTMDDFGTGYSSLSSLGRLPLDAVKIDQSFLRRLLEPRGSLPVLQSIVRLAHGMRLEVVAEGVETKAELDLVRVLGCDRVQGHLYGPALRPEDAEQLLARNEVLQPV